MKILLRQRFLFACCVGSTAGALLWSLPLERPRAIIPALPAGQFKLWGQCPRVPYFSSDSAQIVTADWMPGPEGHDSAVQLWRTNTGRNIRTLESAKRSLHQIVGFTFSPDGRLLAMNEQESIIVWDLSSGRERKRFSPTLATWAHTLYYSPKNGLLMHDAQRPKLWDVETGRPLVELAGLDGEYVAGGEGQALVRVGKQLQVRDIVSGGLRAAFDLPETDLADLRLSISPNARALMACRQGNLERELPALEFVCQSAPESLLRAEAKDPLLLPALSPDGTCVAGTVATPEVVPWWRQCLEAVGLSSAQPDCTIRILEIPSGRAVATLRGPRWSFFAPDGQTLACVCDDGSIQLWDFPLRKPRGLILGGATLAAALVWLAAWWIVRRRTAARPMRP